MNDQQFDDLKQFITTTVSQTEANLDGKIANLDGKIELLRQEMHEGFSGVGEAVEHILTQIDDIEVSTDRRLKKLEKQSA